MYKNNIQQVGDKFFKNNFQCFVECIASSICFISFSFNQVINSQSTPGKACDTPVHRGTVVENHGTNQ